MNERTHFFRKIYPSHFIFERVAKGLRKGWCWLCVRGELETGTDCYILIESSSGHSRTSSSFCWDAQPWVTEGPSPLSGAGSHSAGILTPTATGIRTPNCLELNRIDWNSNSNWLKPSVAPDYIIVWHPPAPNSTTSTGQGDIPISLTGCTYFHPSAYLHRCISWLTARSRVNMLHKSLSTLNDIIAYRLWVWVTLGTPYFLPSAKLN